MNEETPDQYDMWPSKETHESVGIHMTDFNFRCERIARFRKKGVGDMGTNFIYFVGGDYDGDRKMDDLKFFYRAYIADALSGGCMEKDKVDAYSICTNIILCLYCRQSALIRKKLEEVFQDFQDTSESSNDNTNIVNIPQEPFVFNQDPSENSSQSPPHIDHHCCYECGDSLDDIFCQRCTCKSCGNGAHYGYNCPPKVPIISNPEPCNNQTVDELPQTLPSFDPTCYSGDGNSFTYDSTPNFVNDSPNVFNPPPQPQYVPYSCELCGNDAHHVNLDSYTPEPSQCWKIPIYCHNDDDEESSIPLRDIIISELPPCIAITPVLYTKEPVDSLIIEDEHLDTIPETESDEFIKSSVENLVQNPSESEDFSDIESECDVPVCDNSTTFSNPLFDANDDFSSSDDESFSDEDVPKEIYSNPLFDEEIISDKIDASIISSPKIDSLLEQFSGELAHIDLIPPGINEADFDPEEDIRFIERLLYDNSSPRPPEAFQANPNTIIESLPTFPIPVEDSDSLREEIDIFPGPDDSIPPGIESDDDVVEDIPVDVPNILPTHPTLLMDFDFIPSHNDLGSDLDVSSPSGDRNKIYDPGICIKVESTKFLATLSPVIDTLLLFSSESEDKIFNHGVLTSKDKSPPSSSHRGFKASKNLRGWDILFLEELLSNDPLSLPENESFHFDHYYVPSSPRPPEKPPDDDDVYFDIEPDTGVFTKVVDDISDNSTRELYVHVPNVLPTLPTLSPMFDTLLPFSSENDDKVFNPRILASNEEKSPHRLSHRGFKAFQVISDFSKSPMMIYEGNIPILDVLIAPDYEASRARGFVLRSLELQSFA
ncbi:putative ribonuclease H-like domain-containing protein [Tanacetum coccineum]|uniref:Ribonuclease H-like domain-containing protein n=1 Tax=Tanacetum coccineum TaxID=301880 RepID=A0ABQ5I5U9_9ASTR